MILELYKNNFFNRILLRKQYEQLIVIFNLSTKFIYNFEKKN